MIHGQNLCSISLLCGLDGTTERDKLTPALVKKKIRYRNIPPGDEWKAHLAKELIDLRDDDNLTLPGFSADEQKFILDQLCVL